MENKGKFFYYDFNINWYLYYSKESNNNPFYDNFLYLNKYINDLYQNKIDFPTFYENTKRFVSILLECKIVNNNFTESRLYMNWEIQGRKLDRLEEIKNKIISFCNDSKYNENGNKILQGLSWDMFGFNLIFYPKNLSKLKNKKDRVMLYLHYNIEQSNDELLD